ncbi:type II toxin-antitoxin system RelE/ParE family toxin [Duganella sp. 3397]|uniref:type II toxin-antitoxin system RelE/ParE family toxin n=1 Tax=Duganella sp. 3397 TaxID=2817732 RepID=UPI003857E955
MKTTKLTPSFQAWLDGIKDEITRATIVQKISNLQRGLGDTRSLGDGLKELRIHFGAGWRVYYIEVEGTLLSCSPAGSSVLRRRTLQQRRALANIKTASAARTRTVGKPTAKPAAKSPKQ